MTEIADQLAELDEADQLAIRRTILAASPAAKAPHPFESDDGKFCRICGLGSAGKPHRGMRDAATHNRISREVDRRLLKQYRADDEAVYQARRRATMAQVEAERA